MENFLTPFLEKGAALSCRKAPINLNDSTESSIINYLQKIIFKHDVLVEFKKVLNLTCSSEPFSVKNDVIKKIIKGLHTVLLSDEDDKIKADVFRYVFQSFVSSCGEDESLYILQFFLILSHILGMNTLTAIKDISQCEFIISEENFRKGFKVDVSPISSGSFIILKELLLCLSKTSINLNSAEVQSYTKWLLNLIRNIANFQPFQNIFMEIFYIGAELDLKLFEGNIDDIFCNIFAQGQLPVENFPEVYARFLQRTYKICAQFQRTVKFITKFLSGLKATPTTLPLEVILPLDFCSEFSKVVSVSSNQQSLSLLDVLVQNIDESFSLISQKESGLESPLLFISSKLIISFLQNVKLYAPNIAFTTLQAFIDKMNNFIKVLQSFGSFLLNNKSFILNNENILQAFLELCFYCGEIQMLINCYKDSILNPSHIKESSADCSWHCISPEQWKKLVNYILKSKLENCDSQFFQLAMQKLRAYQLDNKSPTEESTLKVILHQLTSDVNKLNIFQQLPPEDFNILIKFLTDKQSKTVTKSIFRRLLENDNKVESANWLSNSEIQENSVFIANLFSEILKHTGSLLGNVIKDKHSTKINWLCDEYLDDCNSISVEVLERLPEEVNVVIKNGKKLRRYITNQECLSRIVEVFKFLPLFCMGEGFRRLGVSFAVVMSVLLADYENAVCFAFESICNYLTLNLDASTCFDVGVFIKSLTELSYQNERTEFVKVKIIESLVRNCANMKFGLSQLGEMIDSAESFKLPSLMKMLEAQVLLYNELGKCWQRAKKRKSDNDIIGTCRTKLAKIISEEYKELPDVQINSDNSDIFLKVLAIEINKAIRLNDENELKSLMEDRFSDYFDFAVKNLKKGFDESCVMFLTIVLQSMPQLRKFLPENSILKIWKTLKTKEKVNWRLFCINSTEEEFSEILDDLLKFSQKFLHSNSDKYSTNCFEIWVSFFDFTKDAKKNSCQLHLQELFNYIHVCDLFLEDLPVRKKIFLMKFFSFCVASKEVIVISELMDAIIHVILKFDVDSSSVDDFQDLYTLEVKVASSVLFKQFVWSKSKIHLIFMMFKHLLMSLMRKCEAGVEIDKDDVFKLSTCAFSLEKKTVELFLAEVMDTHAARPTTRRSEYFLYEELYVNDINLNYSFRDDAAVSRAQQSKQTPTSFRDRSLKWVNLMVKKEKDFARISAYFITALISSIASVTVLPAIKIHLTNCINHFLSISDSHTVAYLMRILKPGYQQVFNSLYVQFKKYHKYSGKI